MGNTMGNKISSGEENLLAARDSKREPEPSARRRLISMSMKISIFEKTKGPIADTFVRDPKTGERKPETPKPKRRRSLVRLTNLALMDEPTPTWDELERMAAAGELPEGTEIVYDDEETAIVSMPGPREKPPEERPPTES